MLKNLAKKLLIDKLGYKPRKLVSVSRNRHTFHVIKGSFRIDVSNQPDLNLIEILGQQVENVYDIGGNIGQTSLLLASNERIRNILFVEPDPYALGIAVENFARNGFLEKFRFSSKVITELVGEKYPFYSYLGDQSGSLYSQQAFTATKQNAYYTVKSSTMDELYEATGIEPGLIKIDVEGSEFRVLEGGLNLINRLKPYLVVEIHLMPDLTINVIKEKIEIYKQKLKHNSSKYLDLENKFHEDLSFLNTYHEKRFWWILNQ